MGKYKHEGKGRNISIGGGKQRSDLFKDMSGGYNAMGDSNKPSPVYNYGGNSVAKRYSPMKKALVGDQNQLPDHLVKAIKAAPEMKGSPMHKSPYKVIGDPNKKMDRLSAKHKSLYDRFEMGQTSEAEEQRMYRLEDRMDKVGKKIKSKKSPLNQGKSSHGKNMMEINKFFKDNPSIPSDASSKTKRKAKKANKTVNQISKLQNKRSSVKTIYEDTDSGPSTRAVKVRSADSNPGSKEKRKTRKLLKTLKQVKGSSPLNQGKKEMSKAEFKKAFEKKSKNPGDDPKLKKRLSTTQDEKMLQTGRGKTTKSPLNQGKKVRKAVRKAKKYIKAKESVKKQEEKGNYNSFREEGTKKAKRKVKKASKKHDKMRKTVDKLSTSEKKEAVKTFKNK